MPLNAPAEAGKGEAIGALKVYSRLPEVFDYTDEHLLTLLAYPAAVMLANIQVAERASTLSDALRDALYSRSVIDTAKGMLMERLNLDDRQALQVMTDHARREDTVLRKVALDVLNRTVDPPFNRS